MQPSLDGLCTACSGRLLGALQIPEAPWMERWLGNRRWPGWAASRSSRWLLGPTMRYSGPTPHAAGFFVLCSSTVWDSEVRTDHFFGAYWLSGSPDQRGALCITPSAAGLGHPTPGEHKFSAEPIFDGVFDERT